MMRTLRKPLIAGALAGLLACLLSSSATGGTSQTSYIIVHALNPEGMEIASVDGMDPHCVEIYDDDTLIGYGAHDEETYNQPIEISPGSHTIKAKFNGMTLQQDISLQEGQHKTLVFVFTRTTFGLVSHLNSIACSRSVTRSGYAAPYGYRGWLDSFECQTEKDYSGGIHMDGFLENLRTGTDYYARYSFSVNGSSYYGLVESELTLVTYTATPAWQNMGVFYSTQYQHFGRIPGRHGYNWPDIAVIPAQPFDDWYVQADTCSGYYPEIDFARKDDPSVYYTFHAYANDAIRIPVSIPAVDYRKAAWSDGKGNPIDFSVSPGDPHAYFRGESVGEIHGLTMSSVPYDLAGTGIGYEGVELPVASFAYSPENPLVGKAIAFDASSSYDPDGEIASYDWEFGDGSSAEGEIATHAYTETGQYTVTLTVMDNQGLIDTAELGLEVRGEPVVLVHGWQGLPGSKTRRCSEGIGRFDDDGVVNTFEAMAQWFADAGYDVWIAHLDSGPLHTPPIEQNAQCLKDQVAYVRQETGHRVILVAHSMGGLVSRACLNLDGCRDDAAELYTLGSPHAGVNTGLLLKLLAPPKASVPVCLLQPALCQMTTDGMLWFNGQHPNQGGIPFQFIGGYRTPFPTGWVLLPFDGPNDGIVGSHSAVGWLYPTKLNVVQGPAAGRYWTNETHTRGVGHPSYFEASGGDESQAFRCVTWLLRKRPWAECFAATSQALSAAEAEPALSATTVSITGHLASGESVSRTLQIDTSDHSLFYLSWLTGTLSFTLTQPGGQAITPAYAGAHPDVVTYTTGPGGEMSLPFAAYAFTTTVPGLYTATITAGDVGTDTTGYLLFAALETTRTFTVDADASLYQAGDTAVFTGTLQGDSGGITGATVEAALIRSDGVTETLAFADLGTGVYTASYTVPDAPGYLQAAFTASGDDGGTPFTRQVDDLLAIAPHAAWLAGSYGDYPEDGDGDGFDDILALDAGVTATEVGTYTLSASLVGSGQTIAHTAEYAVLATGTQTVTLRFDGWDIRALQISGPYTVTNVYLVDLGAGGLPAEMADDTWVTAAYDWRDFGFGSVYLPLVVKGY